MVRLPLIVVLLAATAGCGAPPSFMRDLTSRPSVAAPEEEAGPMMLITAIDVGQGDATLVVAPSGEAILVDAGPPGAGAAVLDALDAAGVEELEAIIVTHFHEDHFGGVPEVVGRLAPKGVVYDRGEPEREPESPQFPLYEAAVAGRRSALHPGQSLRAGNPHLAVVAAGGVLADGTQIPLGDPPDENAASIVLLIEYAGFRMLVAGDVTGGGGDSPRDTPDVETPLAPEVGDLDILRVAHHGSFTSTNAAFLASTEPELAIISVGDDNDYAHPHRAVIERLLGAGAAVVQTERGWLDLPGPLVQDGGIAIEVAADGSWDLK